MTKKVTNSDIDARIKKLVGDEYKRIGDYTGGTKKLKLLHLTCGKVSEITPNHFIYDGTRCKCNMNTKSPHLFSKLFDKEENRDYKLLTPYVRNTLKVKIHHSCGNDFYMTPKDFKNGRRCPHCFGNKRKTTEQFYEEVKVLTNGVFELIGPYKNNRVKVEILHHGCGESYLVTPKDFLRGNRCPICKQSKGERLVADILTSMNISFTREKRFDDLRVRGSYLPYDFYIKSQNLLIEYDGIQHFKPVAYFGGEHKYKEQQRRDKLKDDFAKENGFNLLRIPYYMEPEIVTKLIKDNIKCKAKDPIR